MMKSVYQLSLLALIFMSSATSKPQFNHIKYALVKTSKACISPYEKIGKQCLYFSRPYEPWGITKSWDQAYKSFYGAAIFCLENGGFLAEQILDVEKALKYCKHLKGTCTPSLIARKGRCYQWSPLDGLETELECNTENLKARFICEQG